MAKAICGDDATRSQYEQALNIAESEHMIFRVRATRLATIKRVAIAAPQERKTYSGQPRREEDGSQTAPEQQSGPEIYDEVAAFQQALTRHDAVRPLRAPRPVAPPAGNSQPCRDFHSRAGRCALSGEIPSIEDQAQEQSLGVLILDTT
jgi:hypothetical protein